MKRRRVIEFSNVSDIQDQLPAISASEPQADVIASQVNKRSLDETVKKVVESIQAVDQHRLALDQTRITLEIRRYELDLLGYQLSNLLYKITHPSDV